MDLVLKLLLGIGLAIPCGLNPYLPLLVLGIVGLGKRIPLYAPFDFLASWPSLAILVVLVGLDVFGNKLPQIRALYTKLNYVIRPLAGGLAVAAVISPEVLPSVASFAIGAALATATFYVNSSLRPALLTRNKTAVLLLPLLSVGDDGIAMAVSLLTIFVPTVGGVLAIFILGLMSWWLFSLRQSPVVPVVPTEQ